MKCIGMTMALAISIWRLRSHILNLHLYNKFAAVNASIRGGNFISKWWIRPPYIINAMILDRSCWLTKNIFHLHKHWLNKITGEIAFLQLGPTWLVLPQKWAGEAKFILWVEEDKTGVYTEIVKHLGFHFKQWFSREEVDPKCTDSIGISFTPI